MLLNGISNSFKGLAQHDFLGYDRTPRVTWLKHGHPDMLCDFRTQWKAWVETCGELSQTGGLPMIKYVFLQAAKAAECVQTFAKHEQSQYAGKHVNTWHEFRQFVQVYMQKTREFSAQMRVQLNSTLKAPVNSSGFFKASGDPDDDDALDEALDEPSGASAAAEVYEALDEVSAAPEIHQALDEVSAAPEIHQAFDEVSAAPEIHQAFDEVSAAPEIHQAFDEVDEVDEVAAAPEVDEALDVNEASAAFGLLPSGNATRAACPVQPVQMGSAPRATPPAQSPKQLLHTRPDKEHTASKRARANQRYRENRKVRRLQQTLYSLAQRMHSQLPYPSLSGQQGTKRQLKNKRYRANKRARKHKVDEALDKVDKVDEAAS
jgi:hypothetical protein